MYLETVVFITFKKSADVFFGKELPHDKLVDATFEILEASRNDSGPVKPGDLIEKHVDREPVGQGSGECKKPNVQNEIRP